jgi:predicted nuclease of predicted toxin-antitoxin system
VALRFLIDENLSPLLARHLRRSFGFDAVHVNKVGLSGASDEAILAHAISEHRIVVTSNARDFRKLGRRNPQHPGLAVLLSATGQRRQIKLGGILASTISADVDRGALPNDRLFEIDATGVVSVIPGVGTIDAPAP